MKAVSYTLWGDNPKYCVGAVKNAEGCAIFYPGWTPVFFYAPDVPHHYLDEIVSKNPKSLLIEKNAFPSWVSVLWRLEIIDQEDVEMAIFRDTDSRISDREVAAVNEWVNSEKMAHIMRDHPQGHGQAIMPGMLGLKKGAINDAKGLIEKFGGSDHYGTDYTFFNTIIYPLISHNALVHDDFFEKKPFPTPRNGLEFVGQVFDELDNPNQEHAHSLGRFL